MFDTRCMYSVKAALPFPLRVEGEFTPKVEGGRVQLRLETRRHDQLDERVAGGGHFDFEVDRAGWLSYTYISAEIDASTRSPFAIFLDGVNAIIENLRDQ